MPSFAQKTLELSVLLIKEEMGQFLTPAEFARKQNLMRTLQEQFEVPIEIATIYDFGHETQNMNNMRRRLARITPVNTKRVRSD
jgi:hypothetical protein